MGDDLTDETEGSLEKKKKSKGKKPSYFDKLVNKFFKKDKGSKSKDKGKRMEYDFATWLGKLTWINTNDY